MLGFTGTQHALHCKVLRERKKAARGKEDERQADPNCSQTDLPASKDFEPAAVAETPADLIAKYLEQNGPRSVGMISINVGLDHYDTLGTLESNSGRFVLNAKGEWSLI